MKKFTNLFGTEIEHKPFFQNCLKVWRVARFEDGELERVYEAKAFKNYDDCLKECNK